jgi:antitoxin component of MazEF toxin-antitoxin module
MATERQPVAAGVYTVQERGGSVYICIPKDGADALGVGPGDQARVCLFDDGRGELDLEPDG